MLVSATLFIQCDTQNALCDEPGERVEVDPVIVDDRTDGGALIKRHINLIDCDKLLHMYLTPFMRLYEDKYYWWQVWEIFRRLFQVR